ncbi:glutathione S-transferase N-terminal domain-containing protein [Haloprofundus salinisoli]|uniref:glutathione S-transferase N-terminal domain-containing protein n=1 Tax=Haloprofundus salinisoli TaxID=2876193 RepID=UPI001CC90D10|nr:glutathione S-transferase N-terminal domain-containing protein [Haloprofundus salinisoli]
MVPSNRMLELYQAEGCPHCAKVRDKLSELGVSYVSHTPRLPGGEGGDVVNRQAYDEMLALGEADQIPFLVDHDRGARLYESDAIVAYLDDHYGDSRASRTEIDVREPDSGGLRGTVAGVAGRLLQVVR